MVRLLWIVCFMVVTGAGCASQDSASTVVEPAPASAADMAVEAKEMAPPPANRADPAPVQPQSPLLIYTASLTLEVENPLSARDSAWVWVRQAGGYSSHEMQQQLGNREVLEIAVRVPATQFQLVMRQLERAARRVEDRRIVAQDVTQEFTDNEARLRTKRATEAQYLELLKRAGKISDILEVQNQLAQVREEIEVIEGRQRYFQNQIRYSTITVNFFRLGQAPVYAEPGFFAQLWDRLQSGWDGLLAFVLALVSIWPLFLILGLLYGAWRRWGSKLGRKSGTGPGPKAS